MGTRLKVLKDFLEQGGVVLSTVTPASVIKAAISAKVIAGGDIWMRALDARNRMAHTYSLKTFEQIIIDIRAQYLAAFQALHLALSHQIAGTPPDG